MSQRRLVFQSHDHEVEGRAIPVDIDPGIPLLRTRPSRTASSARRLVGGIQLNIDVSSDIQRVRLSHHHHTASMDSMLFLLFEAFVGSCISANLMPEHKENCQSNILACTACIEPGARRVLSLRVTIDCYG